MSVKAVILRTVRPEQTEALKPLLFKMRALAMEQPGYISGETLVNIDDPTEHMVISTWSTLEQWNQWAADPRRTAIQQEIELLLGSRTVFRVYCYG